MPSRLRYDIEVLGFHVGSTLSLGTSSLVLQVSRRVEYALRAMIFLAQQSGGGRVSFKEIASHEHIPSEYLAKILKDLVAAGLILSKRGAAGGYCLAKAAEGVSFLDIIEAADSPVALNFCTEMGGGCDNDSCCAMYSIWQDAEDAMRNVFRRSVLSDLARRHRRPEGSAADTHGEAPAPA